MLKGSCLCGAVRYEIAGELGPIGHCHCRTCQKAHGSAFATTARTKKATFTWTAGEELLGHFESTPGKARTFCKRCGSQLVAAWEHEDEVILRVASLDSDPGTQALVHIWTEDKAPWYEIGDKLPQFAQGIARR